MRRADEGAREFLAQASGTSFFWRDSSRARILFSVMLSVLPATLGIAEEMWVTVRFFLLFSLAKCT